MTSLKLIPADQSSAGPNPIGIVLVIGGLGGLVILVLDNWRRGRRPRSSSKPFVAVEEAGDGDPNQS